MLKMSISLIINLMKEIYEILHYFNFNNTRCLLKKIIVYIFQLISYFFLFFVFKILFLFLNTITQIVFHLVAPKLPINRIKIPVTNCFKITENICLQFILKLLIHFFKSMQQVFKLFLLLNIFLV